MALPGPAAKSIEIAPRMARDDIIKSSARVRINLQFELDRALLQMVRATALLTELERAKALLEQQRAQVRAEECEKAWIEKWNKAVYFGDQRRQQQLLLCDYFNWTRLNHSDMIFSYRLSESAFSKRCCRISDGGSKAKSSRRSKRKYGSPSMQNAKKQCRTFSAGAEFSNNSPQPEQFWFKFTFPSKGNKFLLGNENFDMESGPGKKFLRNHKSLGPLRIAAIQGANECVKQLLKKRSVVEVTEILRDRVNRRIMKDMEAELRNYDMFCALSMAVLPEADLLDFQSSPVRSDFQDSNTKTKVEYEDKYTVKDVVELEKKLFANNKKAVKFSNFQGLEEALLETPGGEIPVYLQDIANKIEKSSGMTETENVLQSSLLLLCAAVHEMDYAALEQLNWERLSTWGATYNKAKDAGFQVKFVKQHLKKILYAYLGFDFKKEIDPKARDKILEAQSNVMADCMSAKKFFEGNPLSHGLFPE